MSKFFLFALCLLRYSVVVDTVSKILVLVIPDFGALFVFVVEKRKRRRRIRGGRQANVAGDRATSVCLPVQADSLGICLAFSASVCDCLALSVFLSLSFSHEDENRVGGGAAGFRGLCVCANARKCACVCALK